MKKEHIVGLIVAAIVAVVIFAGYIGHTTTIYDIEEHPDKYIDKKVTIEAIPGDWLGLAREDTYGGFSGFWIHDKECYGSNPTSISRDIFVVYDGDYPSLTLKDEWGRTSWPSMRVTGIVRHTYIRIGFDEEVGVFYIDGESWEYID